jgi:competence protein ComEC
MVLANKFLFIALSFILGVFLASLNLSFWILLIFSLILFFIFKIKQKLFFAFILALFLLLGFFYYHFRIFLEEKNQNIIFNQEISFRAKIISSVSKYEKYQKFSISFLPPYKGKAEVLADFFSDFNYGDVLAIKGVVLKNKNVFEKPKVVFPEIKKIGFSPEFKIYFWLFKIKNYFLSELKKYLPKDESALASGIILGERTDFSSSLKNAMNSSGTTHIVALSGYNISVLIILISSLFGIFLSKRKAIILVLIFIFLFIAMTGFEASVVRAAIMGSLVILAIFFGRFYSFWHSLIFAAFFMILINPKILVFDLGFQLSFLSLLGITYFKPIFDKLFKFRQGDCGFLNWKENLTTTLGAQLAVCPLLLYKFSNFSAAAFLANILILSFVPLVMFLAFVLGIFGFLNFLGIIISLFLLFILKYQIFIMELFSKIPQFKSSILSFVFIFGIYLFLFIFNFQNKFLKLKHGNEQ